jgi:hypothetical protein
MADGIDEDELKFLVSKRQTLSETDDDTGIWTVVGADGSKVIKLADSPVNP